MAFKFNGETISVEEIRETDVGALRAFCDKHKGIVGGMFIYFDNEGLQAVSYYKNSKAKALFDNLEIIKKQRS